jgi:group I intron endonuclease
MSKGSIAARPARVKRPVVYAIEHAQTGRVYVGSTTHCAARWKRHRKDLTEHTHHCAPLQADYDLYGLAAFTFRILETCEIDNQWDREQHWIIALHAKETGYNVNDNYGNMTHTRRTRNSPAEPDRAHAAWQKLFKSA